ncbi:hypothetical protein Vretimale_2103 [Volvox reticuliferus]|uniref:Uncharacterized protein n=1 Tax=Volvox reticuliferus TaxID=1737510 RepID=A0A8J4C4E4_9CHLO|nr:hypothetical protein Vretifemale_4315 [Volvox reticuliferus]GIL96236.1 hypothetical protein Vretimale_2103 [Volvox reticuliferus]
MISSVATAAAVEQVAQERRRRQLDLAGEDSEAQQEPSPSSSEESILCEEAPQIHQTVETFDTQTLCTEFAPGALGSLPNSMVTQLQETDRAPVTPAAGKSKAHMVSSPTDAQAPQPVDLDGPAARTVTPVVAPTNNVSRLVDNVLHLTNERFGASLRVHLKLADEVLQGVAEAADESERGDSISRSQARHLSTQDNLSAADFTAHESPTFAAKVEDVYKYDLMENNPNWKCFLTSSTGLKAQAWESRRQAASSCCGSLLYSPQREWVYMTLSYPDFSLLAYWFGVFMICVILLNTVTFCIESVPRYENTKVYSSLTVVDYVCMGIFTVEYLLRLLCCPNLSRFIRSFSNFIDLVAILPFYVELCVKGSSNEAFQTRIVRLLRVFRVLRIVKSMPRLRHLTLVSDTLRDSTEILIMMACLLLVVLVVFGTIVFFVEPSTFDSIPQAMYYAQTTLTTTGYGDLYPVTPWGRFVAGAAMLLCMVVVSLPIAVIGGNFSEKWSDYKYFRAAVDRSSRVYPTARELRGELEKYERVLDDVMRRLQECEVASEKQLQIVREEIVAARTTLQHGDGGAAGVTSTISTENRLFHVAKNMMRRVRHGSNGALVRHGSYTALPPTTAAPSTRGSATDLMEMANGTVGATSISQGLNQCTDLRGSAALTVRDEPQQEAEGGRAAAAGTEPTGLRSGRSFKAIVASVIRNQVRGQRAEGIITVSESGQGGNTAAVASLGPPTISQTCGLTYLDATNRGSARAAGSSAGALDVPANSSGGPSPPLESVRFCQSSSQQNESSCAPQFHLPPPPTPPAPPPPSPPPLQQPSVTIISHASLGGSSTGAGAAIAPRTSLSAFAHHFSSSITTLFPRKSEAINAETVAGAGADESVPEATPQLQMGRAVLEEAGKRLELAAKACSRAQILRIRHEAFAAQARILRTDEMPAKFEKLDEQYRLLRCWQGELGPMAERMWCLRDALDELAWALQEGMPEEERKYSPASRDARSMADAMLGAVRRKPGGDADTTNRGGSVRAGASAATTILRPEEMVDVSTRTGSARASVTSLQK